MIGCKLVFNLASIDQFETINSSEFASQFLALRIVGRARESGFVAQAAFETSFQSGSFRYQLLQILGCLH